MQTLSNLLKSLGTNNVIPEDKALRIADKIDQERSDTVNLLTSLKKEVGMHWGEEIERHLANMKGTRFNPVDFHYDKPNGDQ